MFAGTDHSVERLDVLGLELADGGRTPCRAYLTPMPASRCISGGHNRVDVDLAADEAFVRIALGRGRCPHCPNQVLAPRLKPTDDGLEEYGYCECCGRWKEWHHRAGERHDPASVDRGIVMAAGLRTLDADGMQGRHGPPVI